MRMIQAWYMDVSRAPGGMVSIVAAFPAPSQTRDGHYNIYFIGTKKGLTGSDANSHGQPPARCLRVEMRELPI